MIPSLVDLAWGVSRNNVQLTEQLAEINDDARRISFARVLARRGFGPETVAQLKPVASVPDPIRNEIVYQLLTRNLFKDAFTVWQGDKNFDSGSAAIIDGGFEGKLSLGETGFGWRIPQAMPGVSMSLNAAQPHSGAKNLNLDFTGGGEGLVLSQLILAHLYRKEAQTGNLSLSSLRLCRRPTP
jgi:hypothetical protein